MVHDLTTHPPLDQSIPKSRKEIQREKCEALGGTYNEAKDRCENIPGDPGSIPKEEGALETFTDPKTGRATGITLPDDRTFLGLSPDEVAEVARLEQRKLARPEGTAPVGTARLLRQEIERKLTLARNVGQIDFELASQLEEQGLNVREILFAGIQGVNIKQAAIAGAAGAAFAAPLAPVTAGAAPVVVGGGAAAASIVLDFFDDVRKNIKDQRQDLVRVKTKELRQRKTAMNNYIQAANMNPAQAEDYILAYNIEKSLVLRDFNTLVKRGNEDLEFWGTDATPQIVEYEVFFESVQPSLDVRMEQAVLKPEPSRAFLSIGDEDET